MKINLPLQDPKPVRGGLRDNAVSLESLGYGERDWVGDGISFTSQCGNTIQRWGCTSLDGDSEAVKDSNLLDPADRFLPTLLVAQAECSGIGGTSSLGDEARGVAHNALEANTYQELAEIMYDGDVFSNMGSSQSMYSIAQIPVGTDAASIASPSGLAATMQGLLDLVYGCNDKDIVFHVPLTFLPHFLAQYIVEWDGSEGRYKMGAYDVSFDCYTNLGPNVVNGIPGVQVNPTVPAEDGSEVWIYATTRPLIGLGQIYDVESIMARTNERVVEAARNVIVAFDPCCVMAAKARVCG